MHLTPVRWLMAALLLGGVGAIAVAPAVAIIDGPHSVGANMETRGSIDLMRRTLRATTSANRSSADWIRELAAPVAAQTKPGAPVIPSRAAIDAGTPTPDTIAWMQLYATRDSIESMRTRFAAGSLGDVGVAISNVGLPRPGKAGYSSWAVLPELLKGTSCVVVIEASALRTYARRGNAFGPCFWYGAFGTPGRGAREWLSETRHRGTGQINGIERSYREARGSPAGTVAAMPRSVAEMVMLSGSSLQLAVCVARGGDSCGRLETDPSLWQWTRFGGSLGDRYGVVPFQASFALDLNRGPGDLYAEFGAERFAKLWRSPLPFPEAFEAAMGLPLNDYMRRAAIREMGGTYHPGPQVDASTLLLLALAVIGLIAVTCLPRARPVAQ
jgi:hypothetical protein